jgi:maltose alpha-D-glucosyltransferase/alpha-amylase
MIHFDRANGMKPFRGENHRTIIYRDDASYFDRAGKGNLEAFWEEFDAHRKSIQDRGFLSWPSGNHDLPRYSVDRSAEDLKVIQTFLMTLPHVPTFYYGDEIGMREQSELPSKEGAYNRTGARTPMQWDDTENAGFSTAESAQLYLPVDADPQAATVARQAGRPDSLLEHFKQLAQLRKTQPALAAEGSIERIDCGAAYPLVYLRKCGTHAALVLLNPFPETLEVTFNLAGKAGDRLLGPAELDSPTENTQHTRVPAVSSTVIEWKI